MTGTRVTERQAPGRQPPGGQGGHPVCPWWLGYVLANPLRRLLHHPRRILAPFVAPGMTVLEPGPGVGHFTLELARLAGPAGRVVAVDVQPRMLQALRRRAARAQLLDRIDVRLARPDSLGVTDLAGRVDFVLAFAVVHEVPAAAHFFDEVAATLKPGGTLLLAEPAGHVGAQQFAATLRTAERAGLLVDGGRTPRIRASRAAALVKPG